MQLGPKAATRAREDELAELLPYAAAIVTADQRDFKVAQWRASCPASGYELREMMWRSTRSVRNPLN